MNSDVFDCYMLPACLLYEFPIHKYVDDSRTEVLFAGLTAHGLYCNLPL